MAFVPGHSHDLFLSYAHDEAAWVDEFRGMLGRQLHERLGRRVEFWRDTEKLRAGEDWVEKIEGAIRATAAFMAVCSPIYFESKECLKESAKAASFRPRDLFIKVVKTPSLTGRHEKFYPNLHRIDFFSGDDSAGFLPGSKEFEDRVMKLASGIAQGLLKLRNSKVAVYVAESAEDMKADRTQVINQLEADGFNVTTADPAFGVDSPAEEIGAERVAMSVFLLGGAWDEYLCDQIRAAAEAGKPAAFWIHPVRSAKAEDKLRRLIEAIQSGEGIPKRSDILGGCSVRDFIQKLQALLRPEKEFALLPAAKNGKVCLIHDAKTPGETRAAGLVRRLIEAQEMAVLEPDGNQPGGPIQASDRLISESDGILLYRGEGPQPDQWLMQSIPQVYCADQLHKSRKRASSFLLANPSPFDQWPGVHVIPCRGEPGPQTLQPFFDRVNEARAANA